LSKDLFISFIYILHTDNQAPTLSASNGASSNNNGPAPPSHEVIVISDDDDDDDNHNSDDIIVISKPTGSNGRSATEVDNHADHGASPNRSKQHSVSARSPRFLSQRLPRERHDRHGSVGSKHSFSKLLWRLRCDGAYG
jgi:hypothetical protein